MTNKPGFIALTTVLTISVVVLALTISMAYLTIGQGQSGLALSKGEDQLNFVEGCMEDALLKIRINDSYAGGAITRPEGTCNISVSQVGITYTVTVTGTTFLYKRTVQTVVTRGVTLNIVSWKEL